MANRHGIGAISAQRNSKFAGEAYAFADNYKTPMDWFAALDEILTDIAHNHGLTPQRTLVGVLEELLGAA